MPKLTNYNRFIRKELNDKASPLVREVWLYTRVSSSQQRENYSLTYQKEESIKFATTHGYVITQTFGNISESASNDFTRKEFMDLISKVKQSRKKPFGILVYVMNRFSRTGGNAISISEELISKMGVHLIEVCSGMDTSTESGRYSIYSKLLEARKQNLDRLEHTIPGMKKFVSTGHCLGNVPFGYDHFGPRVKDPNKRSIEQRIIVNDDGKKLRLAWEWKATGMQDNIIISKLKLLGVNIRKQTISSMWRRPFYCGIQTNKLVGDTPVKGNWEPLISEELFWKVQSIVEGNHHGYAISRDVSERPLIGTLICPRCGNKMSGYEVKRKNLHYYKCQTCKGVSINSNTSRMKFPGKTGAHELFLSLLSSYELSPEMLDPFKFQIEKIMSGFSDSTKGEMAIYKKQISELTNRKDKLEERWAYGDIDKDTYQKFLRRLEDEIKALMEKYKIPDVEISNLQNKLDKVIDFSQNTSKYWVSGSLNVKKSIQNIVFPEGLVLDTEKRQYLTSKVNSLFYLKRDFMRTSGDKKEKLPIKNDEESSLVAEGGFEPPTFGL